MFSLFLQMRKLKLREANHCSPNHVAQSWLVSPVHVWREATIAFSLLGVVGAEMLWLTELR